MQDFDEEQLKEIHMGRLIQVLSHQMKRRSFTQEDDWGLTMTQKHVLKFILMESLNRDIFQKDVEEEFQVRRSTATGMLKLMEKNGFMWENVPDITVSVRKRSIRFCFVRRKQEKMSFV